MKNTKLMAVLASASFGLMGASAFADPLTYTAGDLLLGFRASGGTGADKDYVVNIGQASTYIGASGAITVPVTGVKTDLDATFPSWESRTNVFWSVSAANSAAPSGTVAGEPTRTLFATKARVSAGVLGSAWPRSTASSQSAPALKAIDMANYFTYINGVVSAPASSTANNPKGRVQNKSDINSFASYMPGGTVTNSGSSGISYAYFNPTIEGTPTQVLELYKLNPASSTTSNTPGVLVGTFSLDGGSGAITFTPASAINQSSVYLEVTSASVSEAAGTLTLNVIRGGGTAAAADVTVNTSNGTATAGTDYTAVSSFTAHFDAGATVAPVTIPLVDRTGYQGNRTFSVALSGATGASLVSPASSTVTITDDDSSVAFTPATLAVAEGSTATLTLVRSGATTTTVSVTVDADDDSAIAGTDYTDIASTVVTFAPGETSKTVNVSTAAIAGSQPDRSFKGTLSNLVATAGSSIGGQATVTIEDADVAPIGFTSATISHVPKNSSGTFQPTITIHVARNNGRGTASGDLAMDIMPTGTGYTVLKTTGQAGAPTPPHFTATGLGAVSFADGEASKDIVVTLAPTVPTPGKFKLKLTNALPAAGITSTIVTVEKSDTSKPFVGLTVTGTAAVTDATLDGSFGLFALDANVRDDNAQPFTSVTASLNGIAITGATLTSYTPNALLTFAKSGLQAENGTNTLLITATDAQGNTTIFTKTFSWTNGQFATADAGTYEGVVLATGARSNDTTGFITVTVGPTGSLSGKLTVGGISKSFSGLLTNAGVARFNPTPLKTYLDIIDTTEFDSYLGALSFTVGGGHATGALSTTGVGGTPIADFTADKTPFSGTNLVTGPLLNATTKGVYNVAILSSALGAGYPAGDSPATATVLATGGVTFKGYLADGTAFTAAGKLTAGNKVAFHTNLYKKAGAVAGVLEFNLAATDTDVTATDIAWVRPTLPRARYYPAGWPTGVDVDAIGTAFAAADLDFGQGADALPTPGNAQLEFSLAGLASPVTQGVNVNTLTGAVKTVPATLASYTLSLTPTTGLFNGTFTYATNVKPLFKGVLLNKATSSTPAANRGYGYFLSIPAASTVSTGESGLVKLLP